MARLDRCYIVNALFQDPASRISHYVTKGDGVKFDHRLIYCMMELREAPPRKPCQKMNVKYFKEANKQIQTLLQIEPTRDIFLTKMKKITKIYKVSYKSTKILEVLEGEGGIQTQTINDRKRSPFIGLAQGIPINIRTFEEYIFLNERSKG